MSTPINNGSNGNKTNEWTVMFVFATDNELAPLIVSQVKGIKDAGYQEHTEVVVHCDPSEEGAPTRVYNVNTARKNRATIKTKIGDSSSFIRNLLEDDVRKSSLKSSAAAAQTMGVKELPAESALEGFLNYCAENHRANHYILFLVGHGMIVGNDAFLPDEQPVSGITLKGLGTILRGFAGKAGGTLELLAMHSCSMSGIEVAYELQGTATYMMASEGTSFVGSWPYRQLMMRTFKAIHDKKAQSSEDIGILIEKLYGLSFYNARDFWLSGYSLDLGLCSLDSKRFDGLTEWLRKLVVSLKEGLEDARVRELILLAHLESQSYWGESYTDLYDFCRCLSARCAPDSVQGKIETACTEVMKKLDQVDSENALQRLDALVIHSRNFGSKYQYSHGLSVYFPWAEPTDDGDILKKYNDYAFTTALGEEHSWLSFLKAYFKKTQRPRGVESPAEEARGTSDQIIDVSENEAVAAAAAGVGVGAVLSNGLSGALSSPGDNKTTGSTGAACTCPSIKNYPIDQS